MLPPYPPKDPPKGSGLGKVKLSKKWASIIILVLSIIFTMGVGMIIGYKWGEAAKRRSNIVRGGNNRNSNYNNNNPLITNGKKDLAAVDNSNNDYYYVDTARWIPYGQKLLLSEEEGGAAEFGESIDFNGDATVLALGSYEHNDGTGMVQVKKYYLGKWRKMGNTIYGNFQGERSGSSVQLSRDGETLIVGGMGSVIKHGDDYGRVSAYQYDSYGDKWDQIGNYVRGGYKADRFGISLSMASDGKSWIVGADNNRRDLYKTQRDGYARVFHLKDGMWEQKGQTITGSKGSWTGYAVAMSGNSKIICVGDRKYRVSTDFVPGRVRCFKWAKWPNRNWKRFGSDIIGDYHEEESGYSLSLNEDGTILAIGSARYQSGSVRVFASNYKDDSWEIMGERITGDTDNDEMGFKVSLNKKGDVLAYTGRGYDRKETSYSSSKVGVSTTNNNNVGVVRVRRWNTSLQKWILVGQDITGHKEGDHFGESLALDDTGTTLVASANWGDVEYVNAFRLAPNQ